MQALITTVYMPSPADLTKQLFPMGTMKCKKRIDHHIASNHPLVYLTFEEAEQATLMAAPAAEDSEEWADFIGLAVALGGGLPDPNSWPPEHKSYVLKITISDLKVVATNTLSKAAHLAFGAEHPDVEALLLPDSHDPRSGALRLITQKKLKRRLKLTGSSRVPARARPLA